MLSSNLVTDLRQFCV